MLYEVITEGFTEDAEVVVTAFGTGGKFVAYVVEELRREGHKVGFFRPITLCVITSYSIHYTKLYEQSACRDSFWRSARWVAMALAFRNREPAARSPISSM